MFSLYCQFTVFLTTGGMLLIEQSDSDWMTHQEIYKTINSYLHFLSQLINLFKNIMCPKFKDFISSNRSSLRGDAPLILAQSLFSLSPSRFWAFICRFWVIWYVVTAYNIMHVAKRIFLAASIGSENFSLPYSLLLDYSTFEFTTLPYPTRNWKTTTRRVRKKQKLSG